MPLHYLSMLHDKHENWLIDKIGVDDYIKNVPVLILDCTQDFESNPELCQKYAQQIVDFFAFDCNLDLSTDKKLSLIL